MLKDFVLFNFTSFSTSKVGNNNHLPVTLLIEPHFHAPILSLVFVRLSHPIWLQKKCAKTSDHRGKMYHFSCSLLCFINSNFQHSRQSNFLLAGIKGSVLLKINLCVWVASSISSSQEIQPAFHEVSILEMIINGNGDNLLDNQQFTFFLQVNFPCKKVGLEQDRFIIIIRILACISLSVNCKFPHSLLCHKVLQPLEKLRHVNN